MEGDGKEISQKDTQFISIHSLRMEGDPLRQWQSRRIEISIHSLRMEGDETVRNTDV